MAKVAKRSANFSMKEEYLLINLVEKFKDIIECKKSDTNTVNKKKEIWVELAREFNSTNGEVYRAVSVLKSKYENLKKRAKQKFASAKVYGLQTGSGPPMDVKISAIDEKIKVLIETQVTGRTSEFDDDCDDKENSVSNDMMQLGHINNELSEYSEGNSQNNLPELEPDNISPLVFIPETPRKYIVLSQDKLKKSLPLSKLSCEYSDSIDVTEGNCAEVHTENDKPRLNQNRPMQRVALEVHNSSTPSTSWAINRPIDRVILEDNSPTPSTSWNKCTPQMLRTTPSAPLQIHSNKNMTEQIDEVKTLKQGGARVRSKDPLKCKLGAWAASKLGLVEAQKAMMLEEHEMKLKCMQKKCEAEIEIMRKESEEKMELERREHKLRVDILEIQKNKLLNNSFQPNNL